MNQRSSHDHLSSVTAQHCICLLHRIRQTFTFVWKTFILLIIIIRICTNNKIQVISGLIVTLSVYTIHIYIFVSEHCCFYFSIESSSFKRKSTTRSSDIYMWISHNMCFWFDSRLHVIYVCHRSLALFHCTAWPFHSNHKHINMPWCSYLWQ